MKVYHRKVNLVSNIHVTETTSVDPFVMTPIDVLEAVVVVIVW